MGLSKWSYGLLAACGLSLVCGGWYGWRGNSEQVMELEVVSAPSVGNGIVDGVECLDVENEQIEILNEENDAMAKELVTLRKVSDDLLQLVKEYREDLKYERLISERLKLAVLQSWSDRFDIEQQIHQQTN